MPAQIPGAPVAIGGRTLVIPPLSLVECARYRHLLIRLSKLRDGVFDQNQVQDLARLVHRAALRNYPPLSLDFVLEHLDAANALPALLAVLGRSESAVDDC